MRAMSIPPLLPAGTTIRRDPNRLPLAPQASPPFLRLSEPYDLFLSAGCVLQLHRAAMLRNLGPEATHVEVMVHTTPESRYIVLVPTNDPADPRSEAIATGSGRNYAVRGADDVLMAGGIVQVPGRHYYMETALVELPGSGWVVAADWNQATSQAPGRARGAAEAAPATEPDGGESPAAPEGS